MYSLLIIVTGTFATEIEELAHLQGFTDIAFLDYEQSKWVSPVIGAISDIHLGFSRKRSGSYKSDNQFALNSSNGC